MNWIAIITAFIILSFFPLASATNDISSAYQTNSTTTVISDTWTEYQNVSIATGNGNTTATITLSIAINYSTAQAYGRIKRDGVILEKMALTQSFTPTMVSIVAPTTETTGTHTYAFEAYCAGGRKCTLYNRTFSVVYLNTGSFGTGGNGINTSISNLQNNDTVDQLFVNATFLPIGTYGGIFPNATVNNVNRTDFEVPCDLDGAGVIVSAGYSCRYVINFNASIYEIHFASDVNTTANWTISKATKPTGSSPPIFSAIAYENTSNTGWHTNTSAVGTFVNDDLILIRLDANDNATHPGLYVDMRRS